MTHLPAVTTVVVHIFVMILEVHRKTEVAIAVLAIVVSRTLDIVLHESVPRGEILVAFPAFIMVGRIVEMLIECMLVPKVPVAPVAIYGHCDHRTTTRRLLSPMMDAMISILTTCLRNWVRTE